VSGGQDRTIRLWNPHRGVLVQKYGNVHGYEIRDVQISHDNTKFASCGGDRDVFLWDINTGTCLRRFRGHSQRVNTLAFNSDSSVLASGSLDTSVRLWDCRSNSKQAIQTLTNFRDSISSLLISDAQILVGTVDGCINTLDLRSGTICTDHLGVTISCLSLSSDQNRLLVSCLDDSLRLMDLSNGELLHSYKGHVNHSFMVSSCLSHDDKFVFSGSEDGTVHYWEIQDPSQTSFVKAHKHIVTSVSHHPKSSCLLTSSMDGTIKVWKL